MEMAISTLEVDSSASLGHGGLHGMLGFVREGMALEIQDLELRHCPTAAPRDGLDRLSKSGDAGVANLIEVKAKLLALRKRPPGTRVR